jgi:cell division protein FtsI (penicillin-binding protein 3)
VGYFPAENPVYSCIVVVNAPNNGVYYGSLVAAPVFKEIADNIYSTHLDLHPAFEVQWKDSVHTPLINSGYAQDLHMVTSFLGLAKNSQSAGPWVTALNKGAEVVLQNRSVKEQTGLVPDVQGMNLRDALYLLENCGLRVNVNGTGKVVAQSLNPNTAIKKGDEISITLNL